MAPIKWAFGSKKITKKTFCEKSVSGCFHFLIILDWQCWKPSSPFQLMNTCFKCWRRRKVKSIRVRFHLTHSERVLQWLAQKYPTKLCSHLCVEAIFNGNIWIKVIFRQLIMIPRAKLKYNIFQNFLLARQCMGLITLRVRIFRIRSIISQFVIPLSSEGPTLFY